MKGIFEMERKRQLQEEKGRYPMRQIITLLIIIIFAFSLVQHVYSIDPASEKDSEKPLHLILAVDVSGSVKPFWPSIMSAIFASIDDLKIGDKVIPIAFGTVARILSEPITIKSGLERLQLRKIFSKLQPMDRWTYFTDLIKVTENITRSEPDWILLIFSDCRSDPGPGRIKDVEITQLASSKRLSQGEGVFVIRLIPDNSHSDLKFIDRLRKDEEELKAGGVISTVAVDDDLIKLMHDFIPLLKKDIELAKALLEKKSEAFKNSALSTSSPEKLKTINSETVGEKVEAPTKNETTSGENKRSLTPSSPAKRGAAKATGTELSKKQEEKKGLSSPELVLNRETRPSPFIKGKKETGKDSYNKASELYSPTKKSSPFLQKTVKKLKDFGPKFLILMKKSLGWILGVVFILIIIIALFRILLHQKKAAKEAKDSEQSELKFNEKDEHYSIVVKTSDLNPATYPLISGTNLIFGIDIPIPYIDRGIAILKVKKDKFILEPLTEGISINGCETRNSVELFPGDEIRYGKTSIELISEEAGDSGVIQDSVREEIEEVLSDQIDEEKNEVDLSDEDFSLG